MLAWTYSPAESYHYRAPPSELVAVQVPCQAFCFRAGSSLKQQRRGLVRQASRKKTKGLFHTDCTTLTRVIVHLVSMLGNVHPSILSATPMQQQVIAPSGDAQDWEDVAKVLKGKGVSETDRKSVV